MNVLIVGGDTKGAWQMRGIQLGRAMGARVTANPSANDWAWADRVVLVKRAALKWHKESAAFRGPVVWDALDFWAQPEDNGLPVAEHISRAKVIASMAGVSTIIGATRAMADDLGGVYLPHHCRLGLAPTPPRAKARVVGYDGQQKYLGRWLKALESACASLGLRFVISPSSLSDVDVLVSFRDGRWDGEVCRQWKSGVKYVNAIVSGRPILCQASAAQAELVPIGTTVESVEELTDALAVLIQRDVREEAYRTGLMWQQDFQVKAVAERYAELLADVSRKAA